MKKLITIFIVLTLVFTLCACTGSARHSGNNSSQQLESFSAISSQQSALESSVNSKNPVASLSQPSASNDHVTSETSASSTDKQQHSSSSSSIVSAPSNQNLSTPLDPVDKYFIKSNHKQLDKDKYYQYSLFNDVEKEAYRRLRVAVLSYKNKVDMSDLKISNDRIGNIYLCFLADNPQYFWVNESFSIGHNSDVYLRFTDGVVSDGLDVSKVDFSRIDAKRKAVNQAVFNIVSSIDPDASQYEKELAIHNYLTKMTGYDRVAEYNPITNNVFDPAYDIYGTLVERSAVCTGYTKAFQYLCYVVGINSNIVFGDSHVWNTVRIDGEWYQVDVTWDDPINPDGSSGDGHHKYFNLTSSEMYEVHPRIYNVYYSYGDINVPDCTSTKNAYH